ncbi:MAG: Tryptophan synthase alpha chain [Labilithrix sp.]|nr:Tryptophan synthase alpha chain [Labilithrix sp.]
MRILDRSVIASVLIASGVAAAPIIACSSSDSGAGGSSSGGVDEGGVITPGEGGTGVDGSVITTSCAKSSDCTSGVCNLATKLCEAPTCKDGVKNAAETDIDCGGGVCGKCDTTKACKVAGDCTNAVCRDVGKGLQCQAPSNTDGVKNGLETGIDCGGTGNPKCADGQGCSAKSDCTSSYCKVSVCSPVTPDDGVQNGNETDVDCGGEGAKSCADTKMCLVDADCTSTVCKDTGDGTGLRCQVPSPTDNKKNGVETDVDCGGAGNPTCASGKTCVVGGDCASAGCDYNFKCAIARSCSAHYGGDTCGAGGEGGVGAASWESCCTTIATPSTAPDAVGGVVYMDKYPTTSGRMRVFLETVGYDVRTAVQTMRAAGQVHPVPLKLNGTVDGVNSSLAPTWDLYLPTSFAGNANADELADCTQGGTCMQADGKCGPSKTCVKDVSAGVYTSVVNHLGRTIFKNNEQSASGCFAGAPGTHSFRFPDGTAGDGDPEFNQTVYDTKTLNCVDYLMAQAFCAWDGGRLETVQEWLAAWGSGALPYSAATTQTPVRPTQRCDASSTCTTATSAADCKTSTTSLTCNATSQKCCLPNDDSGDKTYWGCRFPWATDASHAQCGLSWPATTSIEWSDYRYSYEYPKQAGEDYIVFLTAPGRTRGRGPLGHSDIIGSGYELAANLNTSADPLDARSSWTGNGSWEVHSYQKSSWGNTPLLNKYGKLGMRCVKFAPTN